MCYVFTHSLENMCYVFTRPLKKLIHFERSLSDLKNISTKIIKMNFKFSDSDKITRIYDTKNTRSHKWIFLKDDQHRVWDEKQYKGDAVFGGKNFFELLAEMNMSKSRLEKANCTPTEMGMKLYRGTTKLIKKSKGQIINLELKYPEILIDDERIWRGRRPVLVDSECDSDESDESDCECDHCSSNNIMAIAE